MGYLIDSYCHSTPEAAVEAFNSNPRMYSVSSYMYILRGSVVNGVAGYSNSQLQGLNATPSLVTVSAFTPFPTCNTPGESIIINPLNPPPLSDTITATWLAALVLIAAWSISILRRSL